MAGWLSLHSLLAGLVGKPLVGLALTNCPIFNGRRKQEEGARESKGYLMAKLPGKWAHSLSLSLSLFLYLRDEESWRLDAVALGDHKFKGE